jgi:hypothetical protein
MKYFKVVTGSINDRPALNGVLSYPKMRTQALSLLVLILAMLALARPVSAQTVGGTTTFRSLEVAFAATQALDYHGTRLALRNGSGREGNSLLAGVADSPLGLAIVKSAGAAAIIGLSETLWRRGKRKTAIVMLGAITGFYGVYVVPHNYGIARGGRR